MSTENTTIDFDINTFLDTPGADNVIISNEEEKKPNVFSNNVDNLSFLNQEEEEKEEEKPEGEQTEEKSTDILDDLAKTEEVEEETKKAGRPKVEKSGLIEFFKKRIEAQEMVTFDDFDEENGNLDEYLSSLSENDLEELWKENNNLIREQIANEEPQRFYESLPPELQYAAKYALDGGQDLKGLFRALAHVEEVRDLNPEDENDQKAIVKNYLTATKFGEEAEIDEEIEEYLNMGTLAKKAKQFKPKLDLMQEEQVAAQLVEQENRKAQQQKAAQDHINNSYEALKAGELNGIKIDAKVQAALYTGLTKPQYSSVSGRPTNLLGHLLEKYQLVEPNYGLIAEALWLLSNPEQYRDNLIKTGKNKATEEVVRKLKTESSRSKSTVSNGITEEEKPRSLKPQRQTNIFKR